MLEAMLTAAGGPIIQTFPDSGPGSKSLIAGDEEIGYFGEVSSTALITYLGLKTHLGFSAGSVGPDVGWLKFIHKGVVKFLSKKACYWSVSWDALYAAGGVYGTNDLGKFPAAAAMNQYKPFVVPDGTKSCTLVPKLLSGAPNDPTGITAADVTNYNSEFSDLLYRIVPGTHVNAGTFAQYTATDVDMQRVHAVIETDIGNTTYTLIRRNGGINANGTRLRKNDATGYGQYCRMVLVLESSV